jgi:hypothetical protein
MKRVIPISENVLTTDNISEDFIRDKIVVLEATAGNYSIAILSLFNGRYYFKMLNNVKDVWGSFNSTDPIKVIKYYACETHICKVYVFYNLKEFITWMYEESKE